MHKRFQKLFYTVFLANANDIYVVLKHLRVVVRHWDFLASDTFYKKYLADCMHYQNDKRQSNL